MITVGMIDATHSNAGNVPASTPKVAGYVTGSADIVWQPADWARFPLSARIRIDQSPALPLFAAGQADVADVESLAGTPATFASAARIRASHNQLSTLYCSRSNVAACADALARLGVQLAHVNLWVADWSLSQPQASALVGQSLSGLVVVAVQWASPTSNPRTVVPGGSQALVSAQVDLSTADPSWFPSPTAPHGVTHGVVVDSGLNVHSVTSSDGKIWTV